MFSLVRALTSLSIIHLSDPHLPRTSLVYTLVFIPLLLLTTLDRFPLAPRKVSDRATPTRWLSNTSGRWGGGREYSQLLLLLLLPSAITLPPPSNALYILEGGARTYRIVTTKDRRPARSPSPPLFNAHSS